MASVGWAVCLALAETSAMLRRSTDGDTRGGAAPSGSTDIRPAPRRLTSRAGSLLVIFLACFLLHLLLTSLSSSPAAAPAATADTGGRHLSLAALSRFAAPAELSPDKYKLRVTTDREAYLPGEQVFLAMWMLDSSTEQPVAVSSPWTGSALSFQFLVFGPREEPLPGATVVELASGASTAGSTWTVPPNAPLGQCTVVVAFVHEVRGASAPWAKATFTVGTPTTAAAAMASTTQAFVAAAAVAPPPPGPATQHQDRAQLPVAEVLSVKEALPALPTSLLNHALAPDHLETPPPVVDPPVAEETRVPETVAVETQPVPGGRAAALLTPQCAAVRNRNRKVNKVFLASSGRCGSKMLQAALEKQGISVEHTHLNAERLLDLQITRYVQSGMSGGDLQKAMIPVIYVFANPIDVVISLVQRDADTKPDAFGKNMSWVRKHFEHLEAGTEAWNQWSRAGYWDTDILGLGAHFNSHHRPQPWPMFSLRYETERESGHMEALGAFLGLGHALGLPPPSAHTAGSRGSTPRNSRWDRLNAESQARLTRTYGQPQRDMKAAPGSCIWANERPLTAAMVADTRRRTEAGTQAYIEEGRVRHGGGRGGDREMMCLGMKVKHNVRPGASWGTLSMLDRETWLKARCDRVVRQFN